MSKRVIRSSLLVTAAAIIGFFPTRVLAAGPVGGTSASHLHTGITARIALTLYDVPAGLVEGGHGHLSNAVISLAHNDPLSLYKIHHRVGGYYSTFARTATNGITYIADEIDRYRTTGGASFNIWRLSKLVAAQGFTPSQVVPRVGTGRTVSYQKTFTAKGRQHNALALLFQHGNYAVSLLVVGTVGSPVQRLALRLAHKLNNRIHASGG